MPVGRPVDEPGGEDQADIDQLVWPSTRALYDCPRVLTRPDKAAPASMYLRAKTTAVMLFYLGPMQLRFTRCRRAATT